MSKNLRRKSFAASLFVPAVLVLSSSILGVPSMAGQGKTQETPAGQSAADEEARQTILKMEHDRVEYLKVGGSVIADWIDRVYTDDVVCMGSGGGGACTKVEIMAEHRSGERKLRAVNHHDYAVHVHGNTAVLTFRGDNVMERKGKTFTVSVQTTEFWVKQDGMWRIVAHLVNPLGS